MGAIRPLGFVVSKAIGLKEVKTLIMVLICSSYSSASEILHYFKTVAKDYGLMKYMRLNSEVVEAKWNEEDQQWHVKIKRTDAPDTIVEDKAHILINASGVLK